MGTQPAAQRTSTAELNELRRRRLRYLSHAGLALIAAGALVLVWFALTM
jgi:uncharacterized protein YjeT (DUF2065 family)